MGRVIFIILFFVVELTSCVSFWKPTYIQEADYNFVDNRFLKGDRENPLYKYAHIPSWAYENRVAYYQNIRKRLNLKEWADYLDISPKEAQSIVYKNNSPKIIKDKAKQKEFISYKRALKVLTKDDEDDEIDWKRVLREFKPLFKKSRDDFFKTRIAYNIIRAYHHLDKFDKEIAFIDSIKRTDSIVWEWIDSYRAGAIKQKGNRIKASYLFAKIFATHKSDAYIGYYDFDIRSDKEWNSLVKMAKNPQEETLFHFLRAINPKNNELLELIDMTQIDSKSIWVNRLLYLVAQKAQYRVFLLKSGDYEEFYDLEKKDLESYLYTFLEYLKKNQIDDFHKYLLSYFEYIYQNKNINPTEPKAKKLLAYLKFIDTLNKIDEDKISKKLKNTEDFFKGSGIEKSLERYTIKKLSQLYPKGSLKAQLSSYFDDYGRLFDGSRFRKNLTLNSLNEYITLENKKNKNYIENLLLSSPSIWLDSDLINLYYGVLYTQNREFDKALEHIKDLKLPKKGYDDIFDGYESSVMRVSAYNPFNIGFSGNNRESKKNMNYSHKKFLITILKIKKELEKNPNSVMDNFLMATGLYNISDFGNSPMFARIYRNTSVINSKNLNLLEKSEYFYNKVLSLTKDRELRAKVYYQLLKIALDKKMFEYHKKDKNRYYFKPTYQNIKEIYELVKNSQQYQNTYKELLKYKDTKYFKKIKNCATFKYFK
jgi:hypothetical protein